MKANNAILNYINAALFNAKPAIVDADLAQVYRLSKKNGVTGLVWRGMQMLGVHSPVGQTFQAYANKLTYQYLQQSYELERLTKRLEAERIPFVALKGSRIRRLYPSPDLRTSCDIDLLFDAPDEKILALMQDMGYRFLVDAGVTINYAMPPVVEIEMHRTLLDEGMDFSGYFGSVWERCVPAREGSAEHLLTEEDFYAFMIAHMAKHFTRYGCGVRPLVDMYLYNRNLPAEFSREKADTILREIGLLDFEKRLRLLTSAWFEEQNLSQEDEMLTQFIFGAGVYGNTHISATSGIRKSKNRRADKLRKNLRFAFPPMSIMKTQYPLLGKLPFLLPFFWPVRWCRVFSKRRREGMRDIKTYNSVKAEDVQYIAHVMHELHLD